MYRERMFSWARYMNARKRESWKLNVEGWLKDHPQDWVDAMEKYGPKPIGVKDWDKLTVKQKDWMIRYTLRNGRVKYYRNDPRQENPTSRRWSFAEYTPDKPPED
jgi:hypothetical protein